MNAAHVDIAFLIALDEEFRVLRDYVDGWAPVPNRIYGGADYRFDVKSDEGEAYRCVACFMDEMGTGHAGDATHRVLSTWEPLVVINVGIAASLDIKDVRLGDVVVVNVAEEYSARGKISEGPAGPIFERGGAYYRVDSGLISAVRHLEFNNKEKFIAWKDACSQRYIERISPEVRDALVSARKLRPLPELIRCDLASGPIVGAARAFRDWLSSSNRNIKALEMEAAGVLRAIASRPTPAKALVLRGISDLADGDKAELDAVEEGVFRRTAMLNAVELIWVLMETGQLPRRSDASVVEPEFGNKTISPASPGLSELKAGVLDANASVAQLARVALVYSRAIGNAELSAWLKKEIDGYMADGDILPSYRRISVPSCAHLRNVAREVRNLPIPLQSLENNIRVARGLNRDLKDQLMGFARDLQFYNAYMGLAEVEDLSQTEGIQLPWPDAIAHNLIRFITDMELISVWQVLQMGIYRRILDRVRNRILDVVYPDSSAP